MIFHWTTPRPGYHLTLLKEDKYTYLHTDEGMKISNDHNFKTQILSF